LIIVSISTVHNHKQITFISIRFINIHLLILLTLRWLKYASTLIIIHFSHLYQLYLVISHSNYLKCGLNIAKLLSKVHNVLGF